MSKEKTAKTNAVRILEREKIPFQMHTYESDGFLDGVTLADLLGEDRTLVYKTLVTVGKSGGHYVFVIPVAEELDLKKAAKAVGEKSVEMIPVKELFPLTGYVRGGCTAIGMKKDFPTVVDSTAESLPQIIVSGGKLGLQLSLLPQHLIDAVKGRFYPVIVS